MKILNDNPIIDFLQLENESDTGKLMPSGKKVDVEFSVKTMQAHVDYGCGCKITQDKLGNWLFPCEKHYKKAGHFIDEGFIHPHL